MTPAQLKSEISQKAREIGFDQIGVASVDARLDVDGLRLWLAQGRHGQMEWMANPARESPRSLLPDCRSVIVLGLNYRQSGPKREGSIATYALGRDYHKIIPAMTRPLVKFLEELGYSARATTDSAPLLEKPFGVWAGIGWQGKSTLLISERFGPWLLLATILTSAEIPPDSESPCRCGSCTRCLKACPTGALTAPHKIDARRCIAYLTIEHKGPIEPELMELMGGHLFGCDDCLGACPWGRFAEPTQRSEFLPRTWPGLIEILDLDEAGFNRMAIGTPFKRLGLERLQRNTCIVLGNTIATEASEISTPLALRALGKILAAPSASETLRSTADWAIRQIKARS